jgi:hypothetical protein
MGGVGPSLRDNLAKSTANDRIRTKSRVPVERTREELIIIMALTRQKASDAPTTETFLNAVRYTILNVGGLVAQDD